jgi:hypothetical protein
VQGVNRLPEDYDIDECHGCPGQGYGATNSNNNNNNNNNNNAGPAITTTATTV